MFIDYQSEYKSVAGLALSKNMLLFRKSTESVPKTRYGNDSSKQDMLLKKTYSCSQKYGITVDSEWVSKGHPFMDFSM